ncbi:hypothetical protein SEUBUCD646_0M02840 [Saccharomyces eubayanus]|uniref:YMR147W-like protein n=1 Tax=Saccharomyces eubayanus TaxID=1080349 RepID=A0ABN8VFD5_SACEU|nr:hypothetical protein SEUBUCD650_0M02800 [Saccharomyces eubayanus]CAI1669734.1 hypothetical protein SEUBUCD646_0M02840 [Saccharomyces eubayanus]
MAVRSRKRSNKKKTLLRTSVAQENNATYLLAAEELHESSIDLNVGTEAPPVEHLENLMPAKELNHLRKQGLQQLEPINEHENSEDEETMKLESVTKDSGPVSETEVQKLLLSYAFTSGLVQEEDEEDLRGTLTTMSSPSASSVSTYFQAFIEKTKQFFYSLSLYLIEKFQALKNGVYEVFWIIVIYINYWFPNVGNYMRYVNCQYSPGAESSLY